MELTKHEKQLKRKESIDRFEKEKVQSKKEIVTSIHIITLITLVGYFLYLSDFLQNIFKIQDNIVSGILVFIFLVDAFFLYVLVRWIMYFYFYDKMIFVVNTLFDGIEKDFSKFD
jgi:hypothetical protein